MKRYSLTTMRSFIETQHLQDDAEGNLVGYDDYAKLEAKFDALKKDARILIDEMSGHCTVSKADFNAAFDRLEASTEEK